MRHPDHVKLKHVPEFDALRALAATGVMITHYRPLRGIDIVDSFERALVGPCVDLFFALSGFLITGILVKCKELLPVQSMFVTLRQFYIRRFLRILPLYSIAAVLFLVLIPELRQHWFWFLTYAVNFGKSLNPVGWTPLSHFWTLAVEEQFYLAWPLVVLTLSTNNLLRVCMGLACFSLAARAALLMAESNAWAISQSTFCCLEPLTIGAAFAVLQRDGSSTSQLSALSIIVGGIAAMMLYCFSSEWTQHLLARSVNAVVFAGMISTIPLVSGAKCLRFLRLRPLMYLGTISYGLYVRHLPIMWLTEGDPFPFISVAWFPLRVNLLLDSLGMACLTVAIASISWFFMERPLNDLKRYYPYLRDE